MRTLSSLTDLVAADWSTHPTKRFVCHARYEGDVWHIGAPRAPSDPFFAPTHGATLFGFDLPLGVPHAWAQRTGVTSFRTLLGELGQGRWSSFYEVAATSEEIALERPFYPRRPGGTSQTQLVEALGVPDIDALRRICDRKRPGHTTPCPLFWTLGANQVGKAALHGWREVFAPNLQDVALWPFDGTLQDLAQPGAQVCAEIYPADMYGWLGLETSGSKRSQDVRRGHAARLLQVTGARFSPEADAAIRDGFGGGKDGEDRFDAMVGALGLVMLATGERSWVEPEDAWVRAVEGWIAGRT